MIFIYNKVALHDTLLCVVNGNTDWNVENKEVVKINDDITQITMDGTLLGFNIEHASEKIEGLQEGVDLTDNSELNTKVSQLLKENNVEMPLIGTAKQAFTIGFVESCEPHPDSEKLSVCQVNVGNKVLQIVCGAANISQGQHVVVAQIGSMMPTGLLIQPSVLRKVPSNGMICSAKELHLPEEMQEPGIMVLPEDAPIGEQFFTYFEMGM